MESVCPRCRVVNTTGSCGNCNAEIERQCSTDEIVRKVRDQLAYANGSEYFHRTIFPGVIITDGVKFVAETCGAWWLVESIAGALSQGKAKREPFSVWYHCCQWDGEHLRWDISGWTDTPGEGDCIFNRVLDFSSFPEELAMSTPDVPDSGFKFYAEDGWAEGRQVKVLMLPGER